MARKEFDGTCPCCGEKMRITEYTCKKCKIRINGNFEKSSFLNLDAVQLKFAEIFLKNRGNIKEVEKELGVSYPSVKKFLDGVVDALTGSEGEEGEDYVVPRAVTKSETGFSVLKDE